MADSLFATLSLIAGPAVLTNACAIFQNGATMRYGLAIPHWRDLRSSRAHGDGLLGDFSDPDEVLRLASHRVHLLLASLRYLHLAVALFAVTSVLGLVGALLIATMDAVSRVLTWVIVATGMAGLLLLLAAVLTFSREVQCSRKMLTLHVDAGR